MALNEIEQIKKLLEDKKHILITFGGHKKTDAVASALGLSLFLKKLGKRADVVSDRFSLSKNLKFLKGADQIAASFTHLQKFIITIDAKEAGVQELSYDVKDNKLRIFVTPKKGFFTKEKLRTAQSDFKYDAIIVLGTPDLESLGALYDTNVELFYKVPILNIDNAANNEHFGQINVVDLTTTTVAEIVFALAQKLAPEQIDTEIATALLTGIIAATHSFKSGNMKPHTLGTASKLIEFGAERDFIVQNLFRTRSIAALKLWGKALTNLESDPELGLVYTSVTRDDMIRTSAKREDVPEIIDELIANSPDAKMTLLLFEDPDTGAGGGAYTIHGIIATDRGYNALSLLRDYAPIGSVNYATFTVVDVPLPELEKNIRAAIRANMTR